MKSIGCLVVAGILVLLVLWGIGSYNGLVGAQQAVEAQWAQVQSSYQRRADLIPNLVATVKGSAAFEQDTLTQVVEARSRVGQVSPQAGADILNDPQKFQQFQQAQDQLSSALSRLLVVVERYPELRSTQAFQDLMNQLEGTENRINVERNRFNQVAQDYNTRIKRFPTALFANIFGFQPRPYFEAAPGAETAPRVDFSGVEPKVPATATP
ncbi:MAG TPA: LemA family protein [Thermoanaerobaculia bacterium]|nr:LemA family protein [Thermoanaerobaculia bacterium]